MKRYYNENPQVAWWREKAEQAQKDYNTCISLIEHLKIDYLKGKVEAETRRADSNFDIFRGETRYFNSLSWYKKMFYKFKL